MAGMSFCNEFDRCPMMSRHENMRKCRTAMLLTPRLCLQHTTIIRERAGERGFHLVLLNHLLEKGDMLRFDLAFRLKRLG
jgi:hypothetical protein